MKILILGGAGFLGASLAKRLTEDKHNQVTVFDRIRPNFCADNLQAVVGDYQTGTDFLSLTAGQDVVFHSISTTSPRNFRGVYQEFDENIMPLIRLLDACAENHVKKVVFVSSGGTVYGESSGRPFTEADACNPICAYGVHKLAAEKILSLYTRMGKLKAEVIRLANPYGPTQMTNGVGVIAAFIRQIVSGQSIQLIGNPDNLRDYIYIDDVVGAMEAVISYEGPEEVFNVGTGVGTSVRDILRMVCELTGAKPEVTAQPATGADASCNILDIGLLERETGFVPRYSVEAGIGKMLSVMQVKDASRISDKANVDVIGSGLLKGVLAE